MMLLGVLVIFSFGISGVPAPDGHEPHALSRFCYSCHKIGPSEVCTHLAKCHEEGVCQVEVTEEHHGGLVFTYGCVDSTECEAPTLVGKRAPHDQPKCRECCSTDSCNKHLCGAFATSVLTTSSATVATVAPADTCRDHEEDGLTCASLDKHICTNHNHILHELVKAKCPKYCGFCTPSSGAQVTTTQAPSTTTEAPPATTVEATTAKPERECVDIESDGFKCSSFDQFNFCTDPTSFAHSLAQEHCRAHCGICTSTATDAPPQVSTGGVITAAPVATGATAQVIPASTGGVITAAPVTDVITKPSTAAPITAAPSTAAPSTAAPITDAPATTVEATTAIPERECVDIESDGFKCSSFDQLNFCTDPTSFAHSLAQKYCRAHCGICTSTATDAPPQVSTGGVITAAPVATGATAQVIPASTGGVITAAPVATGATAQVIPASTGGVITAVPVATGVTAQVIPASTGGVITAAPVATGATAQVIPASTGGVITAAPVATGATAQVIPASTGGVITAAPVATGATAQVIPASTGGVITAAPVATGATAQVIPASTGGVITAAPVATGATAQVIPASTGGVITAAPVATGATAQVIPASTGGVITAAPVATGATTQVITASTGGVITAAPATGSPPPVSTGGVITAAPAPADTCLDHEEDGVTCASLGKPVCADTNHIIHQMVKAKCPKYCGFCTPSSGGVTMAAFTTTTDVNTVIPTDVDTTTHQG